MCRCVPSSTRSISCKSSGTPFFGCGRGSTNQCPEDLTKYLVSMAQHKVEDEVRRRMTYRKYNISCEESLEQLLAEENFDIPDP